MVELEYINQKLSFSNQIFDIAQIEISFDGVKVKCHNDQNDFWVLFIANETTINGVLQTSAQMIYDTLTNV
jgi:hypothetical protein